jgi:UDP-N-acetylglucosamine acyltransferase
MVGSHVAHDVVIGSHCVFANAVQLAGHAVVEDWVTFGGLSGVAQYARVGESAFVAAAAACERDVPPFVVVQGDRARVRGLNVVGLRRRGVPEASIAALQRAVRKLWTSRVPRSEAMVALSGEEDPYVLRLIQSLRLAAARR